MTENRIRINVNDTVRVKLTEEGHKIMAHDCAMYNLPPRQPDADGFHSFQLWSLMSLFGPHIHMTGPLMFETEMRIDNPIYKRP